MSCSCFLLGIHEELVLNPNTTFLSDVVTTFSSAYLYSQHLGECLGGSEGSLEDM